MTAICCECRRLSEAPVGSKLTDWRCWWCWGRLRRHRKPKVGAVRSAVVKQLPLPGVV